MYNRPSTIVEIAQALQPSDFYFLPYRYLFTAIKQTSVDGDITAEGIMTYVELKNKTAYDTLTAAGGAATIEGTLRDFSLPSNPSVKEQIDILKSLSYRRKAVDIADRIKHFAETNLDNENNRQFEDVEELDSKIKELTYSLADNLRTKEEIETIGSKVDSLIDEIVAGNTMGIDIGFIFPKLNRLIKRLRDGGLFVFGAPEKVGKSSFMLHIAWSIAEKLNIPVAYGDTEMTTEEQLLRICSKISGVPEDKIAENMLETKEEKAKVLAAWEKIKKVPFYHFNVNDMTNNELESKVKLLQMKHGIELFVYDYVKVQSHEVEKGRTDLMLAAKLDTLKEKICKQCGIPVITSGQMYKRDDERGKVNKFAETSHFTKLADVICRLDRCDPSDPNQFGTHYIEMITGRKVRVDDIGKQIFFQFDQEVHSIKEL